MIKNFARWARKWAFLKGALFWNFVLCTTRNSVFCSKFRTCKMEISWNWMLQKNKKFNWEFLYLLKVSWLIIWIKCKKKFSNMIQNDSRLGKHISLCKWYKWLWAFLSFFREHSVIGVISNLSIQDYLFLSILFLSFTCRTRILIHVLFAFIPSFIRFTLQFC